MNCDDVRTLFAYNRWANRRMFSVVKKLTPEQSTWTVQSSFPSVRETVFHILGAEWIWLKRWKGQSPRATAPHPDVSLKGWSSLKADGIPTVQEVSTFDALQSFCNSIEEERQDFLAALTEERLHADLNFNDMSGNPYAEPLVHLMQHLVNHGTYHRGQVTTMLKQLGAEVVSFDMLYFFREISAEAAAASGRGAAG
jgi:uncharacterized damage-inducible protein DinB